MKRTGLSVLVLTQNNVDTIEETLRSVKGIGDEIVVIDGNSTDGTLEICRKHHCRIFQCPWNKRTGYAGLWNFGNASCKNEWIFRLDSDELVTPELKKEIQAWREEEPACSSYRVRRKEYFLERHFLTTNISRLFRKRDSEWVGVTHEDLKVEGKLGQLKGFIDHKNQRQDLDSWATKMSRWTKDQVQGTGGIPKTGKPMLLFRMFFEPLKAFVGMMLYKKLIFKGFPGFIFSVNAAFYNYFIYARAYEAQYVRRRK
jgi:glycosyltransferase involved in cell wall biosynthesis